MYMNALVNPSVSMLQMYKRNTQIFAIIQKQSMTSYRMLSLHERLTMVTSVNLSVGVKRQRWNVTWNHL